MRANILTITLNPTVDYATATPEVVPGPKLRCTQPGVDPGGGGLNVSRAVRHLGGQSLALVAIGGATGARLLQLLAVEGIATVAFQGPGETRQSITVTEETTGRQFRFVMPGSAWSAGDVPRALDTVEQAIGEGTLVVLSGSQPPGVAKDFPAILADHIRGRGARIMVDTSGPALAHLVEAPREGIEVLRMNGEEAEEIDGRTHPLPTDTAAFARRLADGGVARTVIVARGADGSVLATREETWHSVGPAVKVVSRVGAGDSFVGAFALGLARDWPVADCLRLGVAAAAAACTTGGTQLCERETTQRFFETTAATRL